MAGIGNGVRVSLQQMSSNCEVRGMGESSAACLTFGVCDFSVECEEDGWKRVSDDWYVYAHS